MESDDYGETWSSDLTVASVVQWADHKSKIRSFIINGKNLLG